jgi:hypothetical protein
MGYVDIDSAPEHVLEALKAQAGLNTEQSKKVVKVWESLRDEAMPADTWSKIVHVDETSSAMVFERVNDVVEDILKYLRLYAGTEGEEGQSAQEEFETAFRDYAKMLIGGRVGYAMMRSMDVNEHREVRFDEKRMRVGIKDGALAVDEEYTPEQLRLFRASWIIKEIVFSDFRNLKPNEADFVRSVSAMETTEIDEDILDVLEHVFIVAQPNHLYLADRGNFKEIHANAVAEAAKAVKAMNPAPPEHAELFSRFLQMVDEGEEVLSETLALVFRAVAKGKIDKFSMVEDA